MEEDKNLVPLAVAKLADSETAESVPVRSWQAEVTFPDWKGYTDDTLAMDCMYSFFGYHGQGYVVIEAQPGVESFRMYVNGHLIDTSSCIGGQPQTVDIAPYTTDGKNTIQISNIYPADPANTVTVKIPYPQIEGGTIQEEGISPQAVELISDLIRTDIEHGFTSAQLAVIRHGRLVLSEAWGKTNTYLPDGSINADAEDVTTETMYDLASVTKMFSVNYALQKLVTDGDISLDAKITGFLGDEFVSETMEPWYDDAPSLEDIKAWKSELTIRDLLCHEGGFPASPRYYAPYEYTGSEMEAENPLYAGNGADEETKQATIGAICRTPLLYEPGTRTVYSDVDFMVLGLIVEQVTGMDLDSYLKQTFFEPMGLERITYRPLENGFEAGDCAATELNGNTRDGLLDYPGMRTETIQGEVHDETAFESMAGISGHAGLFASAEDLAKLASVMLCGGYGENKFFDRNVMDLFTAPKSGQAGNWGTGWWRQGDNQRVWYFGTQADSNTIGHQGWTGTLAMIDPDRQLIVVYLTNKINTPITDNKTDANQFDGNWYTASTLGFVPQILSIGMDADTDLSEQLLDLTADMAVSSMKLIDPQADPEGDHPSALNAQSKLQVFEERADAWEDQAYAYELRRQVDDAWNNTKIAYGIRAALDAEPSGNTTDEMKIGHAVDLSEEDGADSVEREGDHPDSPYFNRLDFYNMESTDTLTILPHFKTMQQSSEWSCGVASTLMVLNWYDRLGDYNEETLSQLRPQGDTPSATSLTEMIAMFDGVGGFDCYSAIDAGEDVYDIFTFDYIQETLKAGNPIMIGWNDWGGHWQVIIGYDNMGTETTQDDVIIVADPYDTTDHNQDGYGVYGAERFLYNFTFYNFFEGDEPNDMCFLVAVPEE